MATTSVECQSVFHLKNKPGKHVTGYNGHTYLAKSDKTVLVFVGLKIRQVPGRGPNTSEEDWKSVHSQLMEKSNCSFPWCVSCCCLEYYLCLIQPTFLPFTSFLFSVLGIKSHDFKHACHIFNHRAILPDPYNIFLCKADKTRVFVPLMIAHNEPEKMSVSTGDFFSFMFHAQRFPHKGMLPSCHRPPKDRKPQFIFCNHRRAISHFLSFLSTHFE